MEYSPQRAAQSAYLATSTLFNPIESTAEHHSTRSNDIRFTFRDFAAESWDEHQRDVLASHRWLESFIENVQAAGAARSKGARPIMSELMKTPGRKRMGTNTTNTTAKKDPVATLLFPPSRTRYSPAKTTLDKENGPSSFSSLSPERKMFSPASKGKGRAPPSPMRGQSNAASKVFADVVESPIVPTDTPLSASAQRAVELAEQLAQEVEVPEAAMKGSEEEDAVFVAAVEELSTPKAALLASEEDDEDEDDAAIDSQPAESLATEDQANLSIIGEEEEEEDSQSRCSLSNAAGAPLPPRVSPALVPASSLVIPETQFSAAPESSPMAQAATLPQAPAVVPRPSDTISPRPSSSSSLLASLPDADADIEVDVPLNDLPSSLRTNPLSSASLPLSSSTRTPGETTARFGNSSFSAARIGSSSPPHVGTLSVGPNRAPKSSGPMGAGRAQLNFVGLPKKSLGLGLGLGRSMTGLQGWSESQGSQSSQSSTAALFGSSSQPSSSQTQTQATSVGAGLSSTNSVASVVPPSTTAGGVKRKSLTVPEVPNKIARTDPEEAASKARREAMVSRLQSMAARQSVAARSSVSTNATGLFGLGGPKSLGASSSAPMVLPATTVVAPASTLPTPAPTPVEPTFAVAAPSLPPKITAAPLQAPKSPVPAPAPPTKASLLPPTLVRRTSVNDLVKAFERNSDSRLPSPVKPPMTCARSRSPPLSPSSHHAFPSAIARPASPPPAAAPRMVLRSPPRAIVNSTRSPPRVAKRVVEESTTPKGSPVGTSRSILQQLAVAEKEVEVEEPVRRIREVVSRAESEEEEEDGDDEAEAKLAPLPARLDLRSDEEMEVDEAEEREVEEMVVEKGRGAFASAMDARREVVVVEEAAVVKVAVKKTVVKVSPTKMVMPGMFGAAHSEEEEDNSIEVIEPSQLPSQPSKALGKKTSQSSLASSQQSQSQASSSGVLSFFGKPFGNGKKTEPKVVKSIQLAAAAAKKEQQEKERKATLKEEREQKRLAVMQKRQEDDRQKQDEERKIKADGIERKRKERDEAASSQAAAAKPKVVRPKVKVDRVPDEEPAKKRKIEAEVKRPADVKKALPSRPIPSTSNLGSSLNASTGRAGNMAPPKPTANSTSMVGVKFMNDQVRLAGAGGSTFSGLPARVATLNPAASSTHAHSHSSQYQAAASTSQDRSAPPPRSEPEVYQELPDIDSEYSDSGDEGHDDKVKALPDWAQSPALASALYRQQYVNPDDIFGPIPPLSMNEIFRTNSSRITKRTSSACWEGTDALTEADLARYNRQMGFSKK